MRRWVEEEDLIQGAAMRLLAALRTQTPASPGACFSLAAALMRRQLIDLARKLQGPEGMAAHHSSEEQLAQHPVEEETPSKELIERELRIALHEKVDLLPEEVRQVVDLHIYGGLSLPEAARALGITEGRAEYLWLKARKQLSKLLNADDFDR